METKQKVTSNLKITLVLPNITDLKFRSLMAIEQMRQAQFDMLEMILKGGYMSYDTTEIVTGNSYQSRSGIIAVSTKDLNDKEVFALIKLLGFTVTRVEADWRDQLELKQ